jgi:hypothetical protein
MQLGTIEGEVDTSAFTFRATKEVRNFDFVSVKSNDKWILAQVEEVTKHPDGKTEAKASIIGYRDKGLTKAPRRVIEPDSIVYKADQELISDTLGLKDNGLSVGHLETNPDISIFVNDEDFYKHFGVLAQTGAGKCVTPSTSVLMSDGGVKQIENIFEDYQDAVVRSGEDEEIVLLSDCSVKCIDDDFRQTDSDAILGYRKKVDEVLRIKLESGREIEVTREHPLLSAENDHSFTRAENIAEGDHIAVPRRVDTCPNPQIDISQKTESLVKTQLERREKRSTAYKELQEKKMEQTLGQISDSTGVAKGTIENGCIRAENRKNKANLLLLIIQKP